MRAVTVYLRGERGDRRSACIADLLHSGVTGLDVGIGMRWHVAFSNRPFGVKHFQATHQYSVDVARGLALLFGIGTKALVWGFLYARGASGHAAAAPPTSVMNSRRFIRSPR